MKKSKSLLQREVDTMAVVVFLVVALASGAIGYFLGQGSVLGSLLMR